MKEPFLKFFAAMILTMVGGYFLLAALLKLLKLAVK